MDGPTLTPAGGMTVEEYCERLHRAAAAAVAELGGRVQDSLHERLNVPYPPASVGGESPHRRTGRLAAGVTLEVQPDTDQGAVANVLYTREGPDPDVPRYLEKGTDRMAARPAVEPEYEKWLADGPNILIELMNQNMEG